METVIIKARTKSDIKFLLDLAKRIGVSAKTVNTDELEDAQLISLIEEGLKTPNVNRSEIMKALQS